MRLGPFFKVVRLPNIPNIPGHGVFKAINEDFLGHTSKVTQDREFVKRLFCVARNCRGFTGHRQARNPSRGAAHNFRYLLLCDLRVGL